MRRRFGRGRRGRSSGDGRNGPIDAARWFERLCAEQLIPAASLEPLETEDVPAGFAALGTGQSEAGERVLVGFAPRHGGDAVLATLAQAQRLHREEDFRGEAIAVAPQWSIGARRLLTLLGEVPFGFRALAVSALGEDGTGVEPEREAAAVALPAASAASALERPEDRRLFLRALAALEGLAAKHGGAVRGLASSSELVLLSRRTAVLRAAGSRVVLDTLLPERSTVTLSREGLAAAMDRLEGQLRKQLNDRRTRASEEALRAQLLPILGDVAGLRSVTPWPLGGSDPEVLDLVGLDAEGRPVVAALRERLRLANLAPILEAMLALRPALPLLFARARAPLQLAGFRLALAAEESDAAVLDVLSSLTPEHAFYEVRGRRSGTPELRLRDTGAGAPLGGRREPERPAAERGEPRSPVAPAPPAPRAETPEPPRQREPEERRSGEVEEMSLFDLDDEGASERGDSEPRDARRPRRRRRGRRRGRRAGYGEEAAPDARAAVAAEPEGDEDEVEDLLGSDLEHDPGATLAPIGDAVLEEEESSARYEEEEGEEGDGDEEVGEEAGEEDWAAEREARRRARLAKMTVEPEPEETAKPPRRRSAIVAHADRDSVIAALLLARDIRLVEGFWIYPQSELMTFFRSVATDLRRETPIHVVGFEARPARDTIQAAALYSGRLFWYDHHDWPPEDLESLRQAIGADSVDVQPGSGSSIAPVLAMCTRRSRFSDKLVELATGRFSQHDYERWGRVWWHRLGELASQPGDHRGPFQPLLTGRPSDLAKEAGDAPVPPDPPEVAYVAERDFRVVHFGGHELVVVPVPEELDLHLAARVARERFTAEISLAYRESQELVVLSSDDARGRHALDLGAMVDHLAAKHAWIEALRDEDHVARIRVRDVHLRPERLDETVAEVAMGRSIFEG